VSIYHGYVEKDGLQHAPQVAHARVVCREQDERMDFLWGGLPVETKLDGRPLLLVVLSEQL
jgi:hypothetical protein